MFIKILIRSSVFENLFNFQSACSADSYVDILIKIRLDEKKYAQEILKQDMFWNNLCDYKIIRLSKHNNICTLLSCLFTIQQC